MPQDFVIPAAIAATDPDLDAQLEFEIDWESSYATKQGRPAPDVEFHKYEHFLYSDLLVLSFLGQFPFVKSSAEYFSFSSFPLGFDYFASN